LPTFFVLQRLRAIYNSTYLRKREYPETPKHAIILQRCAAGIFNKTPAKRIECFKKNFSGGCTDKGSFLKLILRGFCQRHCFLPDMYTARIFPEA
jgi:hypothetical protein